MSSMIDGDATKIEKIYEKVRLFGTKLSVLAYLAGIVYFCLLPREELVHNTYISENALLPGHVSSDLFSSEMINTYYELLKSHYDLKNKEIDMKFLSELFSNQIKLESYVQNYNVTNPFYDSEQKTEHFKVGRNVYAYARSQRADGTESIVVSAPAYVANNQNNQKISPNFLGISLLLVMADLAKNKPYWAKDMIFIVTDLNNYGMQAWVNSYYDIQSDYIKAENLQKRGGSIQAALNLEFPDTHVHKLELKIEGANGKLPNLDLFNTIIRVCMVNQFQCSLESEKTVANYEFHNQYNQKPKVGYLSGIENTLNMVFKQASGVPSSLHGYFLNHRIEALTISGARFKESNYKRQNPKQNLLKATRIIEGTLRSINNLSERFHQSFFFYLLASSHHYISIGMYMPAFGLIALPLLIKIVSLWFSIILRKPNKHDSDNFKNNSFILEILGLVLPNILISAALGLLFYFGSPYFIFLGKHFRLAPKESILSCYLVLSAQIFLLPSMVNLSSANAKENPGAEFILETSKSLQKLFVLLVLVIFLGTLSLLNFSLAFLLALTYVPVALFAAKQTSNMLAKLIKLFVLVLAMPLVYFGILYLTHAQMHGALDLNNLTQVYQSLMDPFYKFLFLSKICNIWTQDLVHLCLIPIWTSLWFIANAES